MCFTKSLHKLVVSPRIELNNPHVENYQIELPGLKLSMLFTAHFGNLTYGCQPFGTFPYTRQLSAYGQDNYLKGILAFTDINFSSTIVSLKALMKGDVCFPVW